MTEKTDLEIIEDFSRHFCVVCHKEIFIGCGDPIVHIGGCCVGIDHEKEKTLYLRTLASHFHCYVQAKIPKEQKQLKKYTVKLKWKFKEIKEIITLNTKMK